jgi:FK506-binding protein 1
LCSEQVIPGLDEGVSALSIGERAKIAIPASKAYAERGFPGLVPPNTDLVFDLELIKFN